MHFVWKCLVWLTHCMRWKLMHWVQFSWPCSHIHHWSTHPSPSLVNSPIANIHQNLCELDGVSNSQTAVWTQHGVKGHNFCNSPIVSREKMKPILQQCQKSCQNNLVFLLGFPDVSTHLQSCWGSVHQPWSGSPLLPPVGQFWSILDLTCSEPHWRFCTQLGLHPALLSAWQDSPFWWCPCCSCLQPRQAEQLPRTPRECTTVTLSEVVSVSQISASKGSWQSCVLLHAKQIRVLLFSLVFCNKVFTRQCKSDHWYEV